MTIQLSVAIWAVICFVVLYILLKFLIFDPLLAVMKKREEKTEGAKQEKEDRIRLLEKEREEASRLREEEKLRAAEEAKAEVEKILDEGKVLLENAKKERINTVEEYRVKNEAEYEADIHTAENSMDEIADEFLSKLFTHE